MRKKGNIFQTLISHRNKIMIWESRQRPALPKGADIFLPIWRWCWESRQLHPFPSPPSPHPQTNLFSMWARAFLHLDPPSGDFLVLFYQNAYFLFFILCLQDTYFQFLMLCYNNARLLREKEKEESNRPTLIKNRRAGPLIWLIYMGPKQCDHIFLLHFAIMLLVM